MTTTTTETPFYGYLEYSRKRYKLIPENKVFINSRTPVGDPAEYYERKPYGGRREFYPLMKIMSGKIISCEWAHHYNWNQRQWEFKMPKEMADFLESQGVEVPLHEQLVGNTVIIREDGDKTVENQKEGK